jgi:4-amino-4-deoxy-L-arabinose transferase-like glycosyltransferase
VIEDFFLKHNIGRFTQTMESHGGGWFYYIPVFFLGLLPFSFIHFKSLIKIRNLFNDKLGFFLLSWFCLVFLIFSASGTKLPHYILIGYVPLILMSAGRDLETEWKSVAWSGLFLLLIFFSAPLIAPRISPSIPDEYVRSLIAGSVEFDLQYYILMASGLLILAIIMIYKTLKNKVLIIAVVVISGFSTFFIYYGKLQQSPVKEIAVVSADVAEEIILPNHYFPSFSYYSHRVCEIRQPKEGELAFGKVVDFKAYKIKILRQKYGVGLVRIMKPDQ